jgi:hypothetical protein
MYKLSAYDWRSMSCDIYTEGAKKFIPILRKENSVLKL